MKLTSQEVYDLCQDFKYLVKSGEFENLLPIDMKLLSIRDCVLFYRDTKKGGIKVSESVQGVHADKINVKVSEFDGSKLLRMTYIEYPLKELSKFKFLLAPNKVVMSEIGKFYKNI